MKGPGYCMEPTIALGLANRILGLFFILITSKCEETDIKNSRVEKVVKVAIYR